ncbi:MAG TPA: peptidoglycan-binding protein LysM [Rubricoccaceae bacterium]|jgi:nucleoid-associated protein YgaU|nr:peptidoglycan-binding protein LysM [Rubricoccaceae bacterium]
MGLLDFIRDAGRDIFGGNKGNEAEQIKAEIERELGNNIRNLGVTFNDGRVTLQGEATSHAAKEKATLIAGNVRGVEAVEDEALRVAAQQAGAAAGAAAAPAQSTGYRARYYTIKSGDTLSGIAKEYYGDANRWQELFEANREVIKDPDKIYPGQRIRVPVD